MKHFTTTVSVTKKTELSYSGRALCEPVISDYEYDRLEREALRQAAPDSPLHRPGSDRASDYPEPIRTLALSLS